MPAARCQESGFKMHSSNFYNRSLKAKLFIDNLPRDIIQSYVLDLKVFVDSMQLVSNTGFQIAITLFIQRPLYGHFIPLAMTACSRIEINAAMPVTRCFPQLHHNCYSTLFKSREPFCNLQEDLN